LPRFTISSRTGITNKEETLHARRRELTQIASDAATNRGYAVYDDYNEALREEIYQERWL
jgi:hypothetical protein